jgi:hypothetical protein
MFHGSIFILLTAAIGLSFTSTSLLAAGSETKCRQWAAEDEVPAVQAEDYLRGNALRTKQRLLNLISF